MYDGGKPVVKIACCLRTARVTALAARGRCTGGSLRHCTKARLQRRAFARLNKCIAAQSTYDPVYRDNPNYQSTALVQRPEASGAVKPADAESVRQALGTLIRLNAAPPFEPPAPR
jgi:hypothetical protein